MTKKAIFPLVLFLALVLVITGCGKKTPAEKIAFDLYAMSQCPYGSQAEDLIYEVKGDFEDYVNFNVEYIANDNGDGSFTSLHGAPEVEGNKYQLCVKSKYPDKFWDYVKCQNKNYQDLASSFESCAGEVGADFESIKTCAEGDEANTLLSDSIKKSQEVNATASPTFYLAGAPYAGQRTATALQRAICEKIDNEADVCDTLPDLKEVNAYLLNDERCNQAECDVTRLKSQLEATFPKITFNEMDYNTDEGREFYQKYNLIYLPALLFDDSVKEAEGYSQVERYLKQAEDLYNLAIGAGFNPTKEICDNSIDDTGNGQVDCDDSDCDAFLGCRQEIAGRLDLFVMSQCPYGTKALDAMEEVLDNFGSSIDFHVNYIADENADGSFNSLHGQPEVDEDIRELCAIKYYPATYLDYILCRNKNITGDYKSCVANFPKVKTCFEGSEGKGLLSENIKLANDLGIGASPTWMVNNKYKFSGIDAETVKTNFCKYNDVTGCDATLSAQTGTPSGSCN